MSTGNGTASLGAAAWLVFIGFVVLGVGWALGPSAGARESGRIAPEPSSEGEERWLGELRTPYGNARVWERWNGAEVRYTVEVYSPRPFDVAFSRNDEALRFVGFRIRRSEYFPCLAQYPGDLIVTTEGGARYEVSFRARNNAEVRMWIEARVRDARVGKFMVERKPIPGAQ